MNKKKLLFVVGIDWSFVSHRLPIALAALNNGYEVHIAVGITDKREMLEAHGLIVHPLPLKRGSLNPFMEIKTFIAIWKILNKTRPDIAHLVTIKPVLYGGIAARFLPIKAVVVAVAGLGSVFLAEGIRGKLQRLIVFTMYKIAFRKKNIKAIFQNYDDRKRILSISGLPETKSIIIRGSGVDLANYAYTPLPNGVPIVVLAARLLKDKGVREFVKAARILRNRGIKARFCLVGIPDLQNPSSVTAAKLDEWKSEGSVEIWGLRTDIPQVFSNSYMVVLPSYSEGLPKVLIEAAACGRAVVTTDISGCRDAIEENVTGLLVPVKDANALANAMEKLLNDRDLCKKLGEAGRKFAEQEFDIKNVVKTHLDIYKEAINSY